MFKLNPFYFIKDKKSKLLELDITIGNTNIRAPNEHIYNHGNLPKTYDFTPIALIMHSILNSKLNSFEFIDVGANIGDTLSIVKMWDPFIKTTCIEPSSYFFKLLKKNSIQFKNVNLVNKLLCPNYLIDKIEYQSSGQTGATTIRHNEHSQHFETISFEEILINNNTNYVIKSDTDGFDVIIINSLINAIIKKKFQVPIIYFEGPTESDMNLGNISSWLLLLEKLISKKYNILFFMNNGLPYANAQKNITTAKSIMTALHQSFFYNQAFCHYFDILAYQDSVDNSFLKLEEKWPLSWLKP